MFKSNDFADVFIDCIYLLQCLRPLASDLVEPQGRKCAAAALTALLVDEDRNIRQHAAGAMALLTAEKAKGDPLGPGQPVGYRTAGAEQGVLQCLYVVERLIGLLGEDNIAATAMTAPSTVKAG